MRETLFHMNLPNRLTLARLLLALGFAAVFSSGLAYGYRISLVLFIVASVTDYVDGEIARRWGLVTDLGRLMDPLVDKILLLGALVCLVSVGSVPAWVVVVVMSREFLITGLRLMAATKGVVLPAERLGKHKTGWQIAMVLFFLLMLALR